MLPLVRNFSQNDLTSDELFYIVEISFFLIKCTHLRRVTMLLHPLLHSTTSFAGILRSSSASLEELVLDKDPRTIHPFPAVTQRAAPLFVGDLSRLAPALSFSSLRIFMISFDPVFLPAEVSPPRFLSICATAMPVLEHFRLTFTNDRVSTDVFTLEDFAVFTSLKHLCLPSQLAAVFLPIGPDDNLVTVRDLINQFKAKLCAPLRQTLSIFIYDDDSQITMPLIGRFLSEHGFYALHVFDAALDAGFRINDLEPIFGSIPLVAACVSCSSVLCFFESPLLILTAFRGAAVLGMGVATVRHLVSKGADLSLRDIEGMPLHFWFLQSARLKPLSRCRKQFVSTRNYDLRR